MLTKVQAHSEVQSLPVRGCAVNVGRSLVQSKAGADEFEHQLRTALLAPTHRVRRCRRSRPTWLPQLAGARLRLRPRSS